MKKMKFGGLQKTSLVDFPDRLSTVLFTQGCNLRCPFCHNWRLVIKPREPFLSESTVLEILESRKKYIDTVVVTGGEPTIQTALPHFLKKLKEQQFTIKLDTNGFYPGVLEKCLKYIDYIAVDVKTSPEKYFLLGAKDITGFLRTIEIVKRGDIDYEFRSTVVPGFIEEETISKIGELVNGAKRYAIQQFVTGDTLDIAFNKVKPYSLSTIKLFADKLKKYS
ncbi:anaerobic ribonucleoside-triphosphate reductase activating protein, partial [Candidatus Bathyarchaeota archaeon]|nr:anaerobic ribonucleoside-triphosphate reductase activating protein [Candidatus Bathyarchaeota archaeon]